jgi:hypothetical protein
MTTALDAVAAAFDGCVDPRELISKLVGPDQSEVHVNGSGGGLQPKRRKPKGDGSGRVLNTVGQGLNALAIGAGGHALAMAGRDERIQDAAAKGSKAAKVIGAPYKAYSKTKLAAKVGAKSEFAGKYALPLAAGAVGLHTAELVGDSIAAHALHNQAKTKVKKNADLIIKARAMGAIDNERAIELSAQAFAEYEHEVDLIEKGALRAGKIMRAAKLTPGTMKPIRPRAARQAELERAVDEVVPKGKKLLAGMGLTALAGGAAAGGAKGQRMLDQRRATNTVAVNQTPVTKSDVEWSGTISKFDQDKRLVFGWCSISKVDGKEVVDLQGDYVPIETTEDSAYQYVIHSRKGGDMHRRVGKRGLTTNYDQPLHVSDLVESFVVTPEKLEALGLAPDAMPLGWWVGFKVNDDEQWQLVKDGKRPAFSIHGSGKRVEAPDLAHV